MLKYSTDKGFFLNISKRSEMGPSELPDFMVIQSESKETYRCITLELLKFNHRVKESMEEIFLITDRYTLTV